MPFVNKAAPGVEGFFPANEPAIGTPYDKSIYPQNTHIPALFQPLTLKDVTFKNRIFVSAMCQYSSRDGHVTDWHLVHVGGFASRGVGAICMEATAVVPEGRISPDDTGLWDDSHIPGLQRIVNFAHSQGTPIGIQLAHAGRKSSSYAPWIRNEAYAEGVRSYVAQKDENGWPDEVDGPTDVPFSDLHHKPNALSEEKLLHLEDAFLKAVERCKKIGFDFIEIHAAHGYLLHQFVSPISNTREDQYGGQSLENRMRWPLRVIARCREAWSKPLFVRISASDWLPGQEKGPDGIWKQWGIEQSKIFVGEMMKLGVDLLDCSSGGLTTDQDFSDYLTPGYQVPFAEAIKKTHPNIIVGAVGLITDPVVAESYLRDGKADLVFLARALITDPHWALHASETLGVAVKPADQYERGFSWKSQQKAPMFASGKN